MDIALIKNNKVENIIVADLDFASQLGYDEILDTKEYNIGMGWERISGIWTPPSNAPIIEYKSILTPLEFLNRFTDKELEDIIPLTESNIQVKIWWLRYNKAQDMNLDDPQTIAGVQGLEAAGLIGVGRANEILTKYPI